MRLELALMVFSMILFLKAIRNYSKVDSVGDLTELPLDPIRVRACQLFFLAACMALTFSLGFLKTLPYWSVLSGSGMYSIYIAVKKVSNS